jgi:hypothetical protein
MLIDNYSGRLYAKIKNDFVSLGVSKLHFEKHLPRKFSDLIENLGNITEGWYAIYKTKTDPINQLQGFSGHIAYITNHDGIKDADYPDWIDEDNTDIMCILLVENEL